MSVMHGTTGASAAERVMMTEVGLEIPGDLSYDNWERAGRRLSGIVDSSSWWLGDWLVFGKQHFADRYETALRAVGLQYQTLRNYAWVARRFEIDRRRSGLTFQHHAELASLPEDEQDAWLDRAQEGEWTTKRLRQQIRTARTVSPAPAQAAAVLPRIVVASGRLERWQQAARLAGEDLDNWLTSHLDRAAAYVLDQEAELAS